HYGLATGNALIQHLLQEAAQRRSWASEEESTEQASQTSSPSQSSVREKSSTPRKRKAPLPPLGTPSQEDRDAYEEIVRLRQERAQFLQKIRGLEQQEKQRRERAELDEASLRSMEKQIQELEERLVARDGEKEKLGKEVEALRSRLSSMENEKENTSYDIETLQDEEGDPLEFPGAEMLLSKKTLSPSAEELLATLQGQVQSLTVQNKELREKIQVLENYERDESSPPAPGDVVPASLYQALQRELERLRAQGREATARAGGDGQRAASEPVPEGTAGPRPAEEPAWAWGECKAALGELGVQTSSSSSPSGEREPGAELAEARAALKRAQTELEERERRLKELRARLEAAEAAASPGASVEEASREKEALLERCGRAEAEAEALRRELEARPREPARQQAEAEAQLAELRAALARREAELGALRERLREHEEEAPAWPQRARAEGWVPRDEHARATAALQEQARGLRERLAQLEAAADAKAREAARLQAELAAAVPRAQHEAAEAGLRAEAAALVQRLQELERRHEKTCEEVFRVQRQALFMKSERQAAEDRLGAAQKQLEQAQDEARRLRELHGHAEDAARLVRDRDRKITELSKEVFRLKEALNALPESGGPPQSPPNTAALQARIQALEEKLEETETRHSKVVTLYRSHLLYAVQGHMDEDVQRLLCQILRMQRLQEQGR
ncbi:ankyrin repeat domain-containing protein 24, partial [Motacilla alba alba]